MNPDRSPDADRPDEDVDAAFARIIAGWDDTPSLPDPPSPPKRSHRAAESRSDRLARWRFDTVIAATALVHHLTLITRNASDFSKITGLKTIDPHTI